MLAAMIVPRMFRIMVTVGGADMSFTRLLRRAGWKPALQLWAFVAICHCALSSGI